MRRLAIGSVLVAFLIYGCSETPVEREHTSLFLRPDSLFFDPKFEGADWSQGKPNEGLLYHSETGTLHFYAQRILGSDTVLNMNMRLAIVRDTGIYEFSGPPGNDLSYYHSGPKQLEWVLVAGNAWITKLDTTSSGSISGIIEGMFVGFEDSNRTDTIWVDGARFEGFSLRRR